MFKKEAKFMLYVLLVPIMLGVLGALIVPRLFNSGCKNAIIKEILSPDQKRKIVVFARDCGATTGYSTQVSLISIKVK
ncbi:MAG: hypothetical protein HY035_01370 [Nitrospirae bacterium]|nr:hypothetical protein [Nitrospirota bacterium]MBI3377039.1 hypothetical protein [Nitrospirota bacterium]